MYILESDNSEKVIYNKADFPIHISQRNLSQYPNYTAISHWHDEVEFIAVLSGKMLYNVNGKVIEISEGNGIFVNTRQFHYGYSTEKEECVFVCILLHPVLLCSSKYLENKFIQPILQNKDFSYCPLNSSIEWENSIINCLKRIQEALFFDTAELKIQSLFFTIWDELSAHIQSFEKKTYPDHSLSALKDMMEFIQKNYEDKISLKDIAAAGNVGKTSCCNIFQKFTNQTPNIYLTNYRLQKSLELLVTTNLPITDICYEAGFSGVSYFSETFKKNYNCTPSNYRKRHIGKKIYI